MPKGDKEKHRKKSIRALSGSGLLYDREKTRELCVELIKKYQLLCIADLMILLPISKALFNQMFPLDSEARFEILNMIDQQKVEIKGEMRLRWVKDKASPKLQLAAYNLLATPEERAALNSSYSRNENTSTVDLKANISVSVVSDPDCPSLSNNEDEIK